MRLSIILWLIIMGAGIEQTFFVEAVLSPKEGEHSVALLAIFGLILAGAQDVKELLS